MHIPADWESFQLKDVTYESRMRAANLSATHLVVFGVNNQTGLSTESKYHADNLDRYKIVKPGMFAYNPMRLNIGSIGYCNEEIGEGLVSPDYVVFGCKESKLDSKYFSYYIQGHQWRNWVQRAGAGSVRIRIYYEDIGIYPIILPPLQEQCKITEILSTWDDAIVKTEQFIAALQKRKKGLMQRLLTGDIRFPEFAQSDKRAGDLPFGWKAVKVKDIAEVNSGSTPLRSQHDHYYKNGSIPWVKTMDLTQSDIVSTDELITKAALKESSLKVFGPGTVFVAMYGGFNQIGRTGLLTFEGTCNQALSAIIVDQEKIIPRYLLYWLNSNVKLWRRFAASSRKDPNITRNDVLSFPILLPSLPEQRKITEVFHACDSEVNLHAKKLEALRQQKKALMQRLLTGQVRVKV